MATAIAERKPLFEYRGSQPRAFGPSEPLRHGSRSRFPGSYAANGSGTHSAAFLFSPAAP
jgi:hypothetical protein